MPEPNATGGGNPGTGQPGGSTGSPGTGEGFDPTKFVTAEDFGKTAALIGGMKKALEAATARLEGLPTLEKLAEIGVLEKGDDGAYKPRTAPPKDQKKAGPDDEVKTKMESLERQLSESRRALEQEQQRHATEQKHGAIRAALAKANAINPDRDYVHLAGRIVASEAGGYGAKGKDKYGQEIDVTLEQAVEEFLTANPELRKAAAQPGSGTPAKAGTQGAGGPKAIPRSQWEDMAWMAANHDKFLKGEYVRGE